MAMASLACRGAQAHVQTISDAGSAWWSAGQRCRSSAVAASSHCRKRCSRLRSCCGAWLVVGSAVRCPETLHTGASARCTPAMRCVGRMGCSMARVDKQIVRKPALLRIAPASSTPQQVWTAIHAEVAMALRRFNSSAHSGCLCQCFSMIAVWMLVSTGSGSSSAGSGAGWRAQDF